MYYDELKDRMRERGISRTQLAKASGMDYKTLSARLNGNTDFKVQELLTICSLLHIRVKDLDFDEGTRRENRIK